MEHMWTIMMCLRCKLNELWAKATPSIESGSYIKLHAGYSCLLLVDLFVFEVNSAGRGVGGFKLFQVTRTRAFSVSWPDPSHGVPHFYCSY
jgi:hypothetical protein